MRKNHFCISKHQLWVLQCICLLVFSSCTSEFEPFRQSQNDEFLEFTFTTADSRANINSDGSGYFTEGDVIGLCISNGGRTEFRKLEFSNGQWTPLLRRSDFGDGELSITAHYPFISESEESVSFSIPTEQNVDGCNPADVLFAKSSLPVDEYKVNMKFNHMMHRLIINPKDDLKEAEIKVRTVVNGKINLITGEAAVSSDASSFEYIIPKKNSDGSLEAIIYPQPTDDYKTDEGLISIKLNGKETIYKAPEKYSDGTVLEKFEGGKTFTINLSAAISDSYWANKKVWVYGINPPEEGAWKQFYTNYSTYYLPLKQEYGWYDVNKRNPSDNYEGVPDGMMCWAASASNLIHWWTFMNKEYIDRYIELGRYKGPDCKYDFEKAQTQKEQESQIFQTFIDSFEDQAGNIDDGVNWFIHGIKPRLPAMHSPVNSAGYFKDVFPDGVKLATNIGGIGKETFNKVIKDALLNNKAIGFNSGTVKNSHAMTIWGVEFDETGNVSYIYFVDNNDRYDYLNHSDYYLICIRNKIMDMIMPEGGAMIGHHTGFMEDGELIGDPKPINRLYTLELGTEYWKDYFNKVENKK